MKWPKYRKSVIVVLLMASASLVCAQTVQTLWSFNSTNGAGPYGNLTVGSDGILYGTTIGGGSNNSGTVFRLLLPPATVIQPPTLAIQRSAGHPLLSLYGMLSNNFTVQFNTNLAETNWEHLLSVTNLQNSPYQFLDPVGDEPARFYRAFMQ